MFRKIVLVTLALLLISIKPTFATDEPLVKDPESQISIGITIPLTGSLAHIGEDIRRGVELAVKDLQQDSPSFNIVYEDNQHQSAKAVSSARKLLDIDDVDVIVSLWDMADVIAPLAETKKIPHLSIRWNPHIAEQYKYTVTVESTYISYSHSQVELLKTLGAKTIAIVTEETHGWNLASDELESYAQKNGLKVLSKQNFVQTNKDFTTIVTKLLADKPDAVVLNAHQPYLDVLIKRIHEQRPRQFVTGFYEAVEPPTLIEGLPFVAQFEASPWFEQRFSDEYGERFKARAPHGYDLLKLVDYGFKESKNAKSSEEFMKRLATLKNFPGASGSLSINKTRNIESDCVWRIVKQGSFVNLTPEIIKSYKLGEDS